jgi:hypothetical protein
MLFWALVGLKVLICLFLYSFSILCLVPLGLEGYQQWNKKQDTKDLAKLITCSVFVLCFLSFIGVALVNVFYASDAMFSYAYGLVRLVFVFGLTIFISYFSVPQTMQLFNKWRKVKNPKHFSLFVFFGTLSAYAFLIILTLFLPSKIGFLDFVHFGCRS